MLIYAQIVEELEDRYGDRIDDILSVVRSSLTEPTAADAVNGVNEGEAAPEPFIYSEETYMGGAERWEDDANEVVFDDMGEGAGIEGDLDIDED